MDGYMCYPVGCYAKKIVRNNLYYVYDRNTNEVEKLNGVELRKLLKIAPIWGYKVETDELLKNRIYQGTCIDVPNEFLLVYKKHVWLWYANNGYEFTPVSDYLVHLESLDPIKIYIGFMGLLADDVQIKGISYSRFKRMMLVEEL